MTQHSCLSLDVQLRTMLMELLSLLSAKRSSPAASVFLRSFRVRFAKSVFVSTLISPSLLDGGAEMSVYYVPSAWLRSSRYCRDSLSTSPLSCFSNMLSRVCCWRFFGLFRLVCELEVCAERRLGPADILMVLWVGPFCPQGR